MAASVSSRRVWRTGVLGAGFAAIANSAVFLIGRAVDVSFLIPGFGSDTSLRPVTLVQVVLSTFMPLIVGTGLAALMVFRGRGVRGLQLPGGAVALVSIAVPLSLEANWATKLLLASMHLVAGVVFVYSLQQSKEVATIAHSPVGSDTSSPGTA
jgi:hypothetical protein